MTKTEQAREKFNRSDHLFKIAAAVFLVYAAGVLTFVAVQGFITQQTIAHNQAENARKNEERFKRYTEDNAKQHQLTQQYIRCTGDTLLLKAIATRTSQEFDVCSQAAKGGVQ